jgi:hypothetical protein
MATNEVLDYFQFMANQARNNAEGLLTTNPRDPQIEYLIHRANQIEAFIEGVKKGTLSPEFKQRIRDRLIALSNKVDEPGKVPGYYLFTSQAYECFD